MYRSGWLPSAALALLLASPESAVAYDVEADSAANTVFILLWNEKLSVLEFRALLAHLQPGVRVVNLMSQCFSGAFVQAIAPFST